MIGAGVATRVNGWTRTAWDVRYVGLSRCQRLQSTGSVNPLVNEQIQISDDLAHCMRILDATVYVKFSTSRMY
jgi:hypothetical protein